MARNYAIVMNMQDEKLVIPTRWISYDKTSFSYPTSDFTKADIKKLIIEDDDVDENYSEIPLKKIVKLCHDYNTAVHEKNLNGIEEVTDPSDTEKLKVSRKTRNRKAVPKDYVSTVKRPRIEQKRCGNDSDINDQSDDSTVEDPLAMETPSLLEKQIPLQLSVLALPEIASSAAARVGPTVNELRDEDIMKDIENTTTENSVSLQKIYDMQLHLLTKVNYISKKLESNEKILKNQRRQSFAELDSLSKGQLQILDEYFPIDSNENNIKKKMDEVESKLLDKKFAKIVNCRVRCAAIEKTEYCFT